jgi:hypothetical protein
MVAGMLAGTPGHGGASWAVMQYVRGLRLLGHDVLAVEPVQRLERASVSYLASLGLGPAALLVKGTTETAGLSYEEIADFDAELLLNMSGALRERELTAPIATRVFVDMDPVFVQLWQAEGADLGLDEHTHHVTVGQDLAASGVPLEHRWTATLPPVVLADWPFAETLEDNAFTTVGNWRSYGSIERRGVFYGQKAHAMRRLFDLPALTSRALLPALAIHPNERADLHELRRHGWRIGDPALLADTPERYRRFVSGSLAELGLAKAGYVDSRCGWFSDRSACYLAAGRPVVAHDTGFAKALPVGEGLLGFHTAAEAAAAIEEVCADYDQHRSAARQIAERHLDSTVVLNRLLERVL